jgi:hypothetical protein
VNSYKNYICLVCGRFLTLEDENPKCDFCKNSNLLYDSPEIQKAFSTKTDSLSPLEFYENLNLTKEDNYKLEIYSNDNARQKQIKRSAVYTELLYKGYLYNNPLFDKAKFDMRNEWEYECAVEYEARCAESRKRQEEKNKPRCPKCGCTEFQMVPRKWSPLTGFLTNRVDRVCVKCKTRF